MNPHLLGYYQRELSHLRERAGEFAVAHSEVAAALALDADHCADPYVERLLEGFAYLSARIQLKMQTQYDRFTTHLLDRVCPHYLAPTPSMTVVEFGAKANTSALSGSPVPRHSKLRMRKAAKSSRACEFQTAHEVVLWPLKVKAIEYLSGPAALNALEVPHTKAAKAGLRIELECPEGIELSQLQIDHLDFYLGGSEQWRGELYEQLLNDAITIVSRGNAQDPWAARGIEVSQAVGFSDEQALLPVLHRSFQGYRLLQEYFAFAERFMFVRIDHLRPSVRKCRQRTLELVVLFSRGNDELAHGVDQRALVLHCTPAINLFTRRLDSIHLQPSHSEYHLMADRSRPLDFEVHSVLDVQGHGTRNDQQLHFRDFYRHPPLDQQNQGENLSRAFYALRREPRQLSAKARERGHRSSYIGSEVMISLVDAAQAPWQPTLKRLSIKALCTNRDLPLHWVGGSKQGDFDLEEGPAVESVRCLHPPSEPLAALASEQSAWRLISHLALNYLSISDDSNGEQAAAALREMLALYVPQKRRALQRQLEGIVAVHVLPAVRPVRDGGYALMVRGQQIVVTLDEIAFSGASPYLFGEVLATFFARHASLNSFTQLQLRTLQRGEVKTWPAQIGKRQAL